MTEIALVYFTSTDITGQLAQALISEVNHVGATGTAHRIKGSEIIEGRFVNDALFEKLLASDAIIFGSPTYMGGVAAQFKAFADASSKYWVEQQWAGKIAAGITCGSALNGDQSSTLQYLVTFANQHGMYWIGLDSAHGYKDHGVNRLGCQLGVSAHTTHATVNETDLKTARYLGRRVALLAMKL